VSAAAFRASLALNGNPNLPLIERLATELRAELGDEDTDTFLDTLDGETDVLDITDRLLSELGEAEAWERTAKDMALRYTLRAGKMASKQQVLKRALGSILDATGEKTIRRPLATVSRTRPHVSVFITDEESVPTQLSRLTRTPDKAAIKAQLEAGETVPGAELQAGSPGVAVRR
jgi:hypothetical protein